MERRNKLYARKATWLAFGLISLAATISSARDTLQQDHISETTYVSADAPTASPLSAITDTAFVSPTQPVNAQPSEHDLEKQEQDQQAAEASRAFKQAMATLTTLKIHNNLYANAGVFTGGYGNPKSILSSFLPSLQGPGPLGSLIRIIVRLHQMIVNRVLQIFNQDGFFTIVKERQEELKGKAIKVVDLLEHSAELGNPDALFALAHISLFPPTHHFTLDPRHAYETFKQHASRTGNATSQAMLAFFHATGYRGVVPVNQAKAQLYTTFAANGDDKGAQMQLGYRYWSGIGTSDSCQSALTWYRSAAGRSMARFMSGPPGGRTLPQTATKISDLVGGLYGYGASVASTGVNSGRAAIKAGLARAAGETWEDVLEYYLFNAERGEIDFAYRLGKIFYQGSIYASMGGIGSGSEGVGAIPRNFKQARKYFTLITRRVWPADPPSTMVVKDEQKPVNYASAAAGFLGRMHLRGEGVKQDYKMAKAWFDRGAEYGDRECHNGLGIIYRDGLGVRTDTKKALAHFNAAAGQELAEAQVNIGKHHFNRGEVTLATTYFDTALRSGSPFEAYYYLGEIHADQATSTNLPSHVTSSSCSMAVSFYKVVAERGVWDEDLLRDAEAAWMSGTDQDKEVAMLKWWMAAERGYEIAQNNLAYVLDQDKSVLRLTRFSPMTPSNDTAHLALTQWIRAAGQRNIDALVKVGDYYYHGLGVPAEEEKFRFEKAARYYRSASDTQVSALAMWNLGWMYENGVGLPQDYHLAKRYYDLALETNSEAYFPVTLSLIRLYAKSFWHTLMGGTDGLTLWGPDPEEIAAAAKQTEGRQIDDGQRLEGVDERPPDEEHIDEEDGPWYFGKAKEEFHRRKNSKTGGSRREEEDPIQWARDRRDADRERESEFGPEDYFDSTLRGRDREDMEVDELGETLLLVLLCLVISVLLYIRTRMVERMRREQREQQGQNGQPPANGNGIFPPPNDQGRGDWAILR